MADSPERDGFHRGAVTARIIALARSTQAKILVVDDDELELALVCDRLQSCGLEVRQAANGEQALEAQREVGAARGSLAQHNFDQEGAAARIARDQ